jgi:hypothetical protein
VLFRSLTVAHVAAKFGNFPGGIDNAVWELQGCENGETVAHYYVKYQRKLPSPDFDQWSLSDEHGTTVAHYAAARGLLPPGFDMWELTDRRGLTVRDVARMYGQRVHSDPVRDISERTIIDEDDEDEEEEGADPEM